MILRQKTVQNNRMNWWGGGGNVLKAFGKFLVQTRQYILYLLSVTKFTVTEA